MSRLFGATNHPELLDRAVWRRFQVRMTLPGPTRDRLIEWFENFERRIEIPLGYAPSTLAKHFLKSNFAGSGRVRYYRIPPVCTGAAECRNEEYCVQNPSELVSPISHRNSSKGRNSIRMSGFCTDGSNIQS